MIVKLTRVLPDGVAQVYVNLDNAQWWQPDLKGTVIFLENGPEVVVTETPEEIYVLANKT